MVKYPTWRWKHKPSYGPTPEHTIWICDACGNAMWHWYNPLNIPQCYCKRSKKGNPVRMRRGTDKEQEEAKLALEKEI